MNVEVSVTPYAAVRPTFASPVPTPPDASWAPIRSSRAEGWC
jgi:hypothetical protein